MKDKRNILIIALAVFLMGVGLPAISSALDVFAECAYTDVDVECYIYADTAGDELRSGGVKLIYYPAELSNPVATKNDTDWFFADEFGVRIPYMAPETSTAGEVVVIVGKMDGESTGTGVSGARALIGTVKFDRQGGSSTPFGLGLTFGRDDGVDPPNEGYVNFVSTTGTDPGGLDGDINFDHPDFGVPVKVAERGDADADGYIINSDFFQVKNDLDNDVYRVFSDCDHDGFITNSDYFCIKDKM